MNADDINVTELEKVLPKDQSEELSECQKKMTGDIQGSEGFQ